LLAACAAGQFHARPYDRRLAKGAMLRVECTLCLHGTLELGLRSTSMVWMVETKGARPALGHAEAALPRTASMATA